MALQPAQVIASSLVGAAGVMLVEVGRRDRSPVLYVAGACVCSLAVVSLVRTVFGGDDARGCVLNEPAPGYGSA